MDVCLECELSKDGQKVEWFKDSKKIRPDMEHDIQDEGKVHRLIIKKATPKDIGTYRADYMHLSTSGKLSIEGRYHSYYLIITEAHTVEFLLLSGFIFSSVFVNF